MKLAKKKMIWFIPLIVILILGIGVGAAFGFAAIPYKGKKPNEIWRPAEKFDPQKDYAANINMERDEFVILNLADIQLNDLETAAHKPTFEMLDKLIRETKPDLITLTGDQVSGRYVRKTLKKICKFIDSYGIPWAPVLGNHDGQGNVTRNGNGDIYLDPAYKNCVFRKNDPELGVGNYLINIEKDGKPVHTLFMIDSHDTRVYENGRWDYDYIWYSQLAWYEWAVKGIAESNDGVRVPSSCFFHIPLVEYIEAYERYEEGEFQGGNVNRETEGICCPDHKNKENPYNSGFYDKLDELCSTKLVLVGHDHVNCSWVDYGNNGIILAYGLKSSYGSYWDADLVGGTTVTVKTDGATELNYYRYIGGKIVLDNDITGTERNEGNIKDVK